MSSAKLGAGSEGKKELFSSIEFDMPSEAQVEHELMREKTVVDV